MFFFKNVYQGELGKCWYGLLGLNFFIFLESNQESKLGFCLFRKQPCMPSRNATRLLSHVSGPYLKFQTGS
jgi:hypothetical protein